MYTMVRKKTASVPHDLPLLSAAMKGDLKRVKQLVHEGSNVSARNREGCDALIEAIRSDSIPSTRREKIVMFLLLHGAQPRRRDRLGFDAVTWAAIKGRCKLLELLVLSQHFPVQKLRPEWVK